MESGHTFRDYIDFNKRQILSFLEGKDFQSTSDIFDGYGGEKDIYQVRKGLRELKSEGLVIDEIRYVNSKYWKLA